MEPLPSEPVMSDSTLVPQAVVLPGESSADTDSEAWRSELSARLNRYRSRRKVQPPRYPSLHLPFGPAAPAFKAPILQERMPDSAPAPPLVADKIQESAPDVPVVDRPAPLGPAQRVTATQSGAKIIEFPRFAWGPPPPPPDQLAEPVIDRPRILEVPEVTPTAPALGGITIEPAPTVKPEKRLGIDAPQQKVSLARRLLATLIDAMMIGTASAIFGLIFWKIALIRPPQIQIASLSAAIPCLFWAAYQYLLIVYAGTTAGIHTAGLQLAHFDGTSTRRSLRRWRVLASYLSAASLGMGYVWSFLDEDGLCWHDRITHTYLAPRKQNSKPERA